MAVGAYSAIHAAARFGVPWEFALIIGGLASSVIGSLFAFAALRVKGLYLALTTLAMQFVMDWVLTHSPAISGELARLAPVADAGALLGQDDHLRYRLLLCRVRLVCAGDDLHAEPQAHRAGAGAWSPCGKRTLPPRSWA